MGLLEEIREQNREGEYRIPERDKFSSGKLTLPNGTLISYNKIVNRVGYALDVKSYTKQEWNEEGLNIICKTTGLDKEAVQKVVKSLNLHSPYKGIKSQIYWRLVGDKSRDNTRSMWFKDFKENYYRAIPRTAWEGTIVGRCRKWTGEYCPGQVYKGFDYAEDYDPPYLAGVNQNLYLVKNSDNGITYIVHPLDIVSSYTPSHLL